VKVLIVEDDSVVRLLVRELAAKAGHDTEVADDGAAGLEAFRRFRPDLVFSDIRMARMDGLELIEAVRSEDREVITVIITGIDSEDYAVRALRLGANDYLRKPLREADLARLLQKYDAIVKERTTELEIHQMFVDRAFTLKVESRLPLIPKVVDRLLAEAEGAIGAADRLSVRLGLVEMLSNAVEHGNLGISYEEKRKALETRDGLRELIDRRLADPELARRSVTVGFKMDSTTCEWVIADEGSGFDWTDLPDPTSGPALFDGHGRGIFLTRFQFDVMEYQGRGNTVRLVKRR
jgi:CheY-like chemotaxis protein